MEIQPGRPPQILTSLRIRDALAGSRISAVRNKLTGLGRVDRGQLIEAAHAVPVTSAFFDTPDDDTRAWLNELAPGWLP